MLKERIQIKQMEQTELQQQQPEKLIHGLL